MFRLNCVLLQLFPQSLHSGLFLKYLICNLPQICLLNSVSTVLRSKEKIETNCYKFKTKHGSFVTLQSQWFSFVNPWTKEVEYIVSTNTVIAWVFTGVQLLQRVAFGVSSRASTACLSAFAVKVRQQNWTVKQDFWRSGKIANYFEICPKCFHCPLSLNLWPAMLVPVTRRWQEDTSHHTRDLHHARTDGLRWKHWHTDC